MPVSVKYPYSDPSHIGLIPTLTSQDSPSGDASGKWDIVDFLQVPEPDSYQPKDIV